MSAKLRRVSIVFAVAVLLATTAPAFAQFNYFPGDAATNDGRTVALAGDSIETLAQDSLTFILAVPPGVTQFELGVFDGETGQTDGDGQRHWDNGSTQLQYALYFDPFQQGSTAPANLVGVWRGNEVNATSGADWTSSSATFPDNDWWDLTVDVPLPPDPLPGQSPSGATFYHLCVSYRGQTTVSGLVDPCTGDARPIDASPATIANFKLRATTNISVLSFAFAYEAALRPAGNEDVFIIYPEFDGTLPSPDFFLTTPTTYDGDWSFEIDVPTSQDVLTLFGGDFDFGTGSTVGFPSGVTFPACFDTDDPDTPNTATFPPFAVSGGVRIDDSLPEGARAAGVPADDNNFDVFRRTPCIRWTLTSPGADGDISTAGDNVIYANDNPSSQREWEQFRISSEATCDASATCNPLLSNCADFCEPSVLPAGVWRIDLEGVDLFNLNAWRSTNLSGFCINCGALPRPYLVGDTVFEDDDENGIQDAGDPGIPGVLVELLDDNGQVIDTRLTGDPGSYGPGEWEACMARNTGLDTDGLYCFDVSVPDNDPDGVDVESYTVRVAASNFAPGGALFDYFGAEPTASTTSPEQTNDVVEGGDNVLTYDFGYFVEVGSLGDRLWLDLNADGVQDLGEPGINGVTVRLFDSNGDEVASTVTSGDGEYLFEDLPPDEYTVVVDASTLPANLSPTFDLDGLATPNRATGDLGSGEDRRDFDFGYTGCDECKGKVSLLRFIYLGDSSAQVTIVGQRGPRMDDPLFDGTVAAGGEFEIIGPASGNGGFRGTVGTEIDISVDGVFNTTIHTSCSQPIGPGQIWGDFLIVYAESNDGGPLCPLEGGDGGGGDGGGGDGGIGGTGTIGFWKTHPESWPLDAIDVGGVTYTKAEAIELLGVPVKGDITRQLAKQLIAAKLNVASGSEASCIGATIAAADAYLMLNPVGSKPKGGVKKDGDALKDVLDDYNNGRLCAPHRG